MSKDKADPIGKSELACPCCRLGTLVYWRGSVEIHKRDFTAQWLQCDCCGKRTMWVLESKDGTHQARLVLLGKQLGCSRAGIYRRGA